MVSDSPRFRTAAPLPSNLDRCTRCGAPRSAHDADWSCPSGPRPGRGALTLFVAGAGVIAVLGAALWALASAANINLSTFAAFVFLAGITLLAAGLTVAGRQP
jgi:ABC-type multidrug transport system fused ATPase/permease subunit